MEKKKAEFSRFLGFGGFPASESCEVIFGRPHYSAPRKKKSPQFFFSTTNTNGSKPQPNHFLSKSKLIPRNLLWPTRAPEQRRAAAVRIDAPPNDRQFRKNRKKNVPELHLVAIFCEEKSETVRKHRVTRSKITLFRLAIPKMAGFWKKKKRNFGVFWGFGAFRPPNSAKLFLGQPHYSALREKKVRNFFPVR